MNITTIITFIMTHMNTVFTVLGALVTAASAIVALTPSKRDDEVVGVIRSIIERLSVIKSSTTSSAPPSRQ